MSPVDYEALRGGVTTGVPDNGAHTARLERAALIETDKGSNLVTEWSEDGLWWTSWNRFDGQGLPFTQQLLDSLGVDRSTITDDDELEQALSQAQGVLYLVHTDSKQGSKGDRWFINTYVDGRAVPTQDELPVDTEGLPDVDGPGAPAETDVPFHHEPFEIDAF